MKELVVDLVNCCESRISTVEELITGAYDTSVNLDISLAELTKERARLKTSLQEILARNCSLRRKDFNALIDRIISDSGMKKRQLEDERKHVKEVVKGYLDEQKQLVASLRQQLIDFTYEKAARETLEATMADIEAAYQHKGQQVFAYLRDFQLHLGSFKKEQNEINNKLRRLVDRGESLKIEDVRQLEGARAHQERRVERKLRKQEVEILLSHFNDQRQGGNRHRQQ